MGEKITVCTVGDLMICDSPLYASVGAGSQYPKVKGRLFEKCMPVLEKADVVIGNFETVVYQPKNKSLKEIQMCCSEDAVKEMSDAGISVVNLANNHCMQHGTDGFENTRKTCEKYGIKPIGVRDQEPYIREINGTRVAFLALCIHLEWYEPDHIMYEDRIERILDSVKTLRASDDQLVIVVSVHWGDEFAEYPSNAQIALGHKLVELGANIVHGHHSHVLQGIEEYRGGVIVYGNGNFVSDMVAECCRRTGIVTITVEDQKASYRFDPVYIGSDYVPAPTDDTLLRERNERMNNALNHAYSDEQYWKDVSKNHSAGHNEFKRFFKKNVMKYKTGLAVKMIAEFVGRKFKRVVGTTTDGRVSSMDPAIMQALENYRE